MPANPWPRIGVYSRRKKFLSKLGFQSYADYLKSELWTKIRRRVLSRRKGCKVCGNTKYLQIHHTRYTFLNLSGKSTRYLIVLCQKCHEKVSYLERKKNITPALATRQFLRTKTRWFPGNTFWSVCDVAGFYPNYLLLSYDEASLFSLDNI